MGLLDFFRSTKDENLSNENSTKKMEFSSPELTDNEIAIFSDHNMWNIDADFIRHSENPGEISITCDHNLCIYVQPSSKSEYSSMRFYKILFKNAGSDDTNDDEGINPQLCLFQLYHNEQSMNVYASTKYYPKDFRLNNSSKIFLSPGDTFKLGLAFRIYPERMEDFRPTSLWYHSESGVEPRIKCLLKY